jgi:hypothetical protein
MAEAIAGLLRNSARYERMRANAVEASSRFSMTRLAQVYNDLFTKLINQTERITKRISVRAG